MTHLKVAVRVRPLSRREIETSSESILSVEEGNTVAVTNFKVPEQNAGDSRERTRRFTFDFCFLENSTQDEVFEAIETVVGKAIKRRHHSCVLAYGQSSSGKTHTMMGFPHDPGLTPRLCQRIFSYLEETAVGDEIASTKTSVSYLEIYNEKVRDLLCKEEEHRKTRNNLPALRIRQHPKKGPYVQGLTEHSVTDSSTLLHLLQSGNANRRVAATLNNPQSSRSHSVFIITSGGVKLTLVDLAGSERAGSRCCSTSRFREGANINKSLVALGNVISALAELSSKGLRRRFIPYRDSVLTWLLKDTLGGNSDTVMIATISPASACYSETVNTLRFGQRAKLIVSTPVVNEDPREKTIRELRAEIARLKETLTKLSPTEMSESGSIINEGSSDGTKPSSPISEDSITSSICATTEKLIPVMSSSANVTKPTARLRRTYSVEHALVNTANAPKKFGSQETISVKKPPSLRRLSMDKSITRKVLESPSKKAEKGIATENKSFLNVGSRVDSIRRSNPPKPRSQIVAAVTSRLYAKTKKKEVGTDTRDIGVQEVPKELSICSNARERLKELTRKALKAHRTKSEETQTDLFPVLRVKEISTDVDDLKEVLEEVKNVETSTVAVETGDKATGCEFLDSFDNAFSKNAFVLTKSCGTQSSEESSPSVSFTKYLLENHKFEMFNPHTANPIYTSSVNINISHNYINRSDSVSDDSLDRENVCFPTPDLISNHNSLEPHANAEPKENYARKIAATVTVQDLMETTSEIPEFFLKFSNAISRVSPKCEEKLSNVNIPVVWAPEICVVTSESSCQNFFTLSPETARAKIVETKTYSDDCIKLIEPLVLKSIMKHLPETRSEASEDSVSETEVPDSLEYHMANNSKKVRFTKSKTSNERMMKAMSGFLEEATILMNKITMAANKFDEDFDVQVTINDISGLHKRKRKRRTGKHVDCQTDCRKQNSYTQTFPNTSESSTQFCDFDIPINKYEMLLEDSCRRLEEKINLATEDTPLPNCAYNPWDLSEDASIESNPAAFSDYGSLPRRNFKRHRSTCSPSAFLRQLTTMRKQVVDSSRDDLFHRRVE